MRGITCVFVVFFALLLAVIIFAWWLKRRKPQARREPQVVEIKSASPGPVRSAPPLPLAAEAPARLTAEVSLPGLKIVGESHYQEALEELAGGRTEDSAEIEVDVSLVPESDNAHDPNAVGVEIDGELVGYLSRASAKKYRAVFGNATTHEWPARIVGGWDRGSGDRGSFGVQLDE